MFSFDEFSATTGSKNKKCKYSKYSAHLDLTFYTNADLDPAPAPNLPSLPEMK